MKEVLELTVTFRFDNVRGVFEARANGGQRFYFGGAVDAPIPRTLHNALTGLRRETMLMASSRTTPVDVEEGISDDLKEKIRQYEARGGRVQTVGPAPKRTAPLTPLSIEDLDL